MKFTLLALFVGLVCASPVQKRSAKSIPRAENILNLRKHQSLEIPTAFDRLVKHRLAPANASGIAELDGVSYNRAYAVDLTIGQTTLEVILDTGSSDTWVIQRGFSCVTETGAPTNEGDCFFGSEGPTASSTFVANTEGLTFNVSYASGEILLGVMANESITIANITVENQEFGLVDKANWFGDNSTSGLLGLAYPYLTSATDDEDKNGDGRNDSVPYNPWFFSAVKQNKTLPYFSIALDRPTSNGLINTDGLGYLALGGALPLETSGENVTVDIVRYQLRSSTATARNTSSIYVYYTIPIDAYTSDGTSVGSSSNASAILDTGTTLSYLPDTVVSNVFAKISPEPFSTSSGSYYTYCNATFPEIAVTIGGQSFPFNSTDLLLNSGVTETDGSEYCLIGIQPGGSAAANDIFILGDSFMRSHVATFNVQDNEVTLAERAPY